ncbi:MAG: 1-(5-phosphoribosyl)-5-[(5-phosphoribosylamino)methylideneamino]imidazole-4-carboxamide isomerase [Myxococcota bacterium]|nr:1-(5-phosphoribosyl)-5-[(5-phosphoribosylamino)methylideneamino]imidazole-4-carboxamide isomerase [Myxococcota bacterium]MDW8361400.1 1-(5-phosphoribosyl)-5-[(5-phosphoribosylamino)methylideneamino]imidazole-4-carboxamide isomerase [Myxococcales bacterium]
MIVVPAIDLLDGRVVRLRQGNYDAPRWIDDDPGRLARRFAQAGASRLHVVDLDGARDGRPSNLEAVRRILDAASGLLVQLGGGIRTAEVARQWWEHGVERVVLGTAAVERPDLVRALVGERPHGVVVAVDGRAGRVATAGWRRQSEKPIEALAREADGWGVAAILYTCIDRDGEANGPDVETTAALQREVRATVIASGGIRNEEDLRRLRDAGIREAIVGRALYDGTMTLDAIGRFAAGRP